MNFVPKFNLQYSLLATERSSTTGSEKPIGKLNRINQRFGRGVLPLAAEGIDQSLQLMIRINVFFRLYA